MVVPLKAVTPTHQKRKPYSTGHRLLSTSSSFMIHGMAPHYLEELGCQYLLLPEQSRDLATMIRQSLGSIWQPNCMCLYSTCSGKRALCCVPFSLQERQRYVRPTRERLKRCGSLTAGDH